MSNFISYEYVLIAAGRVLGKGGPHAAEVVWIISRVIAVTACGFMLAACSATMPSLSLDFMKSAPAETLAIESEPPGAEAKTSLGQNCRTPCQLRVQPGSEFSVTLTLSGYQPQTVSVRPEADGAVAVPRLAPNPVHVDLQAVAPHICGCRPPMRAHRHPLALPWRDRPPSASERFGTASAIFSRSVRPLWLRWRARRMRRVRPIAFLRRKRRLDRIALLLADSPTPMESTSEEASEEAKDQSEHD